MNQSPFSPRAIVLLIACAAALAAVSVLLHARGAQPRDLPPATAHSYSISAIGHAGFYDLLQRLGRPALRSSGNIPAPVRERGTLVVAAPDLRYMQQAGRFRFTEIPRLLLVLPKWSGTQDEANSAWVSSTELIPLHTAQRVLTLITGGRGSVVRRRLETISAGSLGAGGSAWTPNTIGFDPTLPENVQLIQSGEITPLVGTSDGMLLGEIELSDRKIWVLSDPDVLSNHGIVNGDNAAFMLAVVDSLRVWNNPSPDAVLIFDGTVHGFQPWQASPFSLLFRFPFVVVTILSCIAAALLVLAGMSRFGAPASVKPPLDFGKANLIGNSARLLDYAGHHPEVLARYIGMTLRYAANALRAPRFDDSPDGDMAMCEWLDRVGRSRGVSTSCLGFYRIYQKYKILRAAGISAKKTDGNESALPEVPSLFESAEKIYEWKQEILKGDSVTHGYSSRKLHSK